MHYRFRIQYYPRVLSNSHERIFPVLHLLSQKYVRQNNLFVPESDWRVVCLWSVNRNSSMLKRRRGRNFFMGGSRYQLFQQGSASCISLLKCGANNRFSKSHPLTTKGAVCFCGNALQNRFYPRPCFNCTARHNRRTIKAPSSPPDTPAPTE